MEQQGIFLKNIDLTGISIKEQAKKVNEEMEEFFEAFKEYIENKTEENKNHVLEEFFDDIQTKLGLMEKYGIKSEEVQNYYPKHLEKIKSRPRKKECKKCIEHSDCKLYFSEHWNGEKEAESCRIYKELEE